MNDFGELSKTGVVLSNTQMRERRLRRGECVTCGIKLFKKTLFKSIPISLDGKVLNGRCLSCKPLEGDELIQEGLVLTAEVEIASEKDLRRAHSSILSNSKRPTISTSTHSLSCYEMRMPTQSTLNTNDRSKSDGNVLHHSYHDQIANLPSRDETSVSSASGMHSIDATSIQTTNSTSSTLKSNMSKSRSKESVGQAENEESDKLQIDRSRVKKTPKRGRLQNDGLPRSENKSKSTSRQSVFELVSEQNIGTKQMKNNSNEKDMLMELEKHSNDPSKLLSLASSRVKVPDIQRKVANMLAFYICNSKLTDEYKESIVNDGGITLFLSVLHSESNLSEEDCTNICNALSIYKRNKRAQEVFAENSGIKVLLHVATKFNKSEKINALIVECIGKYCEQKHNARSFTKNGGAEKIISIASEFGESIKIQKVFLKAISNLMNYDDSLRHAILEANAASQISIIMVMFSNDIHIIELSLQILRFLGSSESHHKLLIANSGAIDSIVSVMQLHRDAESIQSSASLTLGELSICSDVAAQIGESGGIEVVTRAILVHAQNEDVVKNSCEALEHLSKYSGNKSIMVEIGVIKVIIQAMKSYMEFPTILSSCMAILSSLANNDKKIAKFIVQNECLDSISIAMVMYWEDRNLQKNACEAIANFLCEETAESIMAISSSELMANASQRFPADCKENSDKVLTVINQL